ncbi:glyoxalase/bleomycin resistance protein/dioxygenase superfamily protein [Patiriisocius marinistellae]|uniref:Glyoxalase/bleomycin resistance protein/dioxygenase superfamily protein n=1 Tax=Patiriisocius marinistellae TaxID=2494560 RepID=A0A5J4G0M7_9FLAO|nr:VOC family protein [Patiriisocius marinistellae]GEQ87142.1 glyoxalase/bleomycin resistance protein/dioxygenase superfamily protein [Patiriisocius marinistellae]
MQNIQPFHLAIPVKNLEDCRKFYRDILGCEEGRSSDHWVDFNFFGHQLVIHFKDSKNDVENSNPVDGKNVPVPHFGVVLSMKDFNLLAKKLKTKDIKFIIEPYIRFEGLSGEQATMFFNDPSGNALEFKAFKNIDQLFAT